MGAFGHAASDKWFIALVDFVRATSQPDTQNILDADVVGAVGWMGVLSESEFEVENLIEQCLGEIGLRVISVEDVQQLEAFSDFEEFDEHLAQNIAGRPEGDPAVVWGTIHIYLAEGEA